VIMNMVKHSIQFLYKSVDKAFVSNLISLCKTNKFFLPAEIVTACLHIHL
jgi:hypothetical protein